LEQRLTRLDLCGSIVSANGLRGRAGNNAGDQQASQNLHICLLRQTFNGRNMLMVLASCWKELFPSLGPWIVNNRTTEDSFDLAPVNLEAVFRVQNLTGSEQT
jgi:hypothetical protein